MNNQYITEMQKIVMSELGNKSWEARVKKYGKKGAMQKMKEYSLMRKKAKKRP